MTETPELLAYRKYQAAYDAVQEFPKNARFDMVRRMIEVEIESATSQLRSEIERGQRRLTEALEAMDKGYDPHMVSHVDVPEMVQLRERIRDLHKRLSTIDWIETGVASGS